MLFNVIHANEPRKTVWGVYNRCCETNSVKYYYWTFYRTTPNSVVSNLEANKYKLLMKIPLDDVEIVKGIH